MIFTRACGFWFFCWLSMVNLGLAEVVQRDHIEVELISELSQVEPGQPFWVGLRLLPDTHWHTYWQNPGDSGLQTRIQWQLPEGASAGHIQWPYPSVVDVAGIINYGYDGEVILLSQITPPSEPKSSQLIIRAKASWLVCEEVCIPGDAELSLSLPYAKPAQTDKRWATKIAETQSRWPQHFDAYSSHYAMSDQTLTLELKAAILDLSDVARLEYFPITADVIDYSSPQLLAWNVENDVIYVRQQKSPYFNQAPASLQGVVVISSKTGEQNAYRFAAQPGTVRVDESKFASSIYPEQKPLLLILLYAFVGGLILNLMPCVFPVLSLKALSLLKQNHQQVLQQRLHGLFYTAGVILSFIAIAGVLMMLRGAGEKIGWGFQLQLPWFNAILTFVFFVLALSLSGFVSINLAWAGAGQGLTERKGYSGSFFTGLLAVLVATPCTAPFMGPAMGYAIMQTNFIALLIFACLGFGLAFPFLLLSMVPTLARHMPKPGQWMETFKQLLAFPLYLTVVYMIWVLGKQTDINSVALVLIGIVLLGFMLWLLNLMRQGRNHAIAFMLSGLCALGMLLIILMLSSLSHKTEEQSSAIPFSKSLLQQLRQEDKTIFVNLTADWCITCKVNERVALNTEAVKAAFEQHEVEYLLGDWTSKNAEISAFLLSFGRTGVPLYLIYSPGQQQPEILPQILTPSIVVEALQQNDQTRQSN